jgi:hypothetical protein
MWPPLPPPKTATTLLVMISPWRPSELAKGGLCGSRGRARVVETGSDRIVLAGGAPRQGARRPRHRKPIREKCSTDIPV